MLLPLSSDVTPKSTPLKQKAYIPGHKRALKAQILIQVKDVLFCVRRSHEETKDNEHNDRLKNLKEKKKKTF